MAKKVLKKYKGGAIDQIAKDPELKAGGGAIHHPVKAQPEDLVKKKAEGGEIKKRHKIDHHSLKGLTQKELKNLPEDSPIRTELTNQLENELADHEEKHGPRTYARTAMQRRRKIGTMTNVPDVGKDKKYVFGITKQQRKALNKKFGHDGKEYRPDLLRAREKARQRMIKANEEFEAHRKKMKAGKYERAKPLYHDDDEFAVGVERHMAGKMADKYIKKHQKKAEGGYVKKDREELKSEVKGMGPEGKAYLRDELKGKKYEGKLKGKYKGDLDKELSGMHARGKEYLKDLVRKSVRREGEKAPEKKRSVIREGEKAHKREGRSVKREGEKPSLGKIIESKALKFKLREGEKIPKKDIVKKAHGGWMQSAVKKPGALRAIAKKNKLIKGDEKLSASDLSKLGSKAKKSGNSLLAKRVSLAKTFAKMRKK